MEARVAVPLGHWHNRAPHTIGRSVDWDILCASSWDLQGVLDEYMPEGRKTESHACHSSWKCAMRKEGISAGEGVLEFTAIGERLTADNLRRVLQLRDCISMSP